MCPNAEIKERCLIKLTETSFENSIIMYKNIQKPIRLEIV